MSHFRAHNEPLCESKALPQCITDNKVQELSVNTHYIWHITYIARILTWMYDFGTDNNQLLCTRARVSGYRVFAVG